MTSKPRLYDIDSAKGLAIALVVLAHLVGSEGATITKDFDWYMVFDHAVYRFHMPFFMFLSGFVFYYTYKPIRSVGDYGRYAARKFLRFGPAYILFGSLMIAGKVFGRLYVPVDSPPESFWRGLVGILLRPSESHAASLWYVYALLFLQLLMPILLPISLNRLEPLMAVALILHFIPTTSFLCLNRVFEHGFLFLAGAYAVSHLATWTSLVDRFRVYFLAVFLVLLVISVAWYVPSYLLSLLSIPALHGLCRLPRWRDSRLLQLFGKYTFVIYLMNTMVIGIEKGLLERYHLWNGQQFIFFAPLMALGALFVPILIKAEIFRRIPILDRITR